MSALPMPGPDVAPRLAVARVTSELSPVVRLDLLTWPELARELTQHEAGRKDGAGWIPASIDPGRRTGERVRNVSALVLDVEAKAERLDNGLRRVIGPLPPPLESVADDLKRWGMAAAVATSHSHEEQAADGGTVGPRYRVAVPVSRPVRPEEVRPLAMHLAARLGLLEAVDTKCMEPARLFYLPRCPPDRRHLAESRVIEGQPLDVDAMLREAAAAAHSRPRVADPSSSVIDAFNEAHDLPTLLERHGYVPAGRNRWAWPGSTSGMPGVVYFPETGRVYSHHELDPLHDEKHALDTFDAWRVLEHGRDLRAAVRAAARLLGHEPQPRRVGTPPGPSLDGWPALDQLPEMTDEAPAAFPFDALGPLLGSAAREIADAVQAPDALAAGSVLAAAAVAVQPFANVVMPHGQAAPLSLYVVTSAESGDRKSATDGVACAPIEERRRKDARAHAAAMADHQAEKAARKGREAASDPPIARTLIVSKGTTEGLHHLLRTQPHVGLFSTEGAELIGGHSMREEKRSAAIAWLLKGWGGETLDSMTRGDGLSVLIGRRVSLHVLLQPVILRGLMADPLAQGQGWIARCLIASPMSLAGTRLWRDDAAPAMQRRAVIEYHARLDALLQTPPPVIGEGDGCELDPRRLPLSDAARGLWCEFYNECERQQQAGAELAGVRAWASKAAEQAARIAAIRTVISDRDAAEVSEDAMSGAIEVVAFYLSEHVRLMGQSRQRQRATQLESLLAFMRERGPSVPHADTLQRAPRHLRALKAEGLATLLDELTQRGYIRRQGDRWEVRP